MHAARVLPPGIVLGTEHAAATSVVFHRLYFQETIKPVQHMFSKF